MSNLKKESPRKIRRPKKRIPAEAPRGLIWREEKEESENPLETKIVFLGKDNLEKLRGYKAFLDLWIDGEVCLTITGQSLESAKTLFDSIEKMRDEEIHGN